MDLPRIRARFERFEGRKPFMYLDGTGQVAVGIGHTLESGQEARTIPFRIGDRPALGAEINGAWLYVAMADKGHASEYYEHLTQCRLTDEAIDALLDSDVDEVLRELRREFPEFDVWPDPAKEAVIDMRFNLGMGGLLRYFPHLIAALRTGNFAAAAQHSHRLDIQESRNVAIRDLFQEAAKA